MARKPDRPRVPHLRLWSVTFVDGETIEIEALHRAEARHYSVSVSRANGYGALSHYARVKSVKLRRKPEGTSDEHL